MECPDCGAPNRPGAAACDECGLELTDAAAEADDDEDFPVVCANGCPEGWRGQHKFSCELARPVETPR